MTFDAGNSFDPDGEIATWRWDFSDQGEPTFSREVVRSYAAPGVYTAQLTVTDDSGAINAVDRDEVEIRINHAPVASAGADIVTSDTTVTFDGSGSADADGDALTYRWDFGDGSPAGAGAAVTHTYAEGGTYPVVLTVDDGTGLRQRHRERRHHRDPSTARRSRSPAATRRSAPATSWCSTAARSSDPGRRPAALSLGLRRRRRRPTSSIRPRPTTRARAYPVTLTVQDESGFANDRHTDRIVVRVDESPIAEAGPDQVACAGAEVHFDGSASRDFDGVVNRFTWDFGDGITGGGERPVHVYSLPGNYRVVLTIEGDQAGQCDNTDTDELTVKVVEAPVARIVGPSAVAVGAPATFDASQSSGATGRDPALAVGLRRRRHRRGAHGRARLRRRPAPTWSGSSIETDATASECNVTAAQHYVVANAPPVADAGADRLVGVDQEVLFDGSRRTRSRRRDHRLAVGLRRRRHRVRHECPPPLPRRAATIPVTLTVTDDTALAEQPRRALPSWSRSTRRRSR